MSDEHKRPPAAWNRHDAVKWALVCLMVGAVPGKIASFKITLPGQAWTLIWLLISGVLFGTLYLLRGSKA